MINKYLFLLRFFGCSITNEGVGSVCRLIEANRLSEVQYMYPVSYDSIVLVFPCPDCHRLGCNLGITDVGVQMLGHCWLKPQIKHTHH